MNLKRDILLTMIGKQYSKQEIDQIGALIAQGLPNRQTASSLQRSGADIRNTRYRAKLKADTRNQPQPLLREKVQLEREVLEPKRDKTQLSWQLEALTKRRQETQTHLEIDRRMLEQKLQTSLADLKTKRPELFYITGAEQLGKLAGYFLQWLFS